MASRISVGIAASAASRSCSSWLMVLGPMIADVTAGWTRVQATASTGRLSPASAARGTRASTTSNLAWFSGLAGSKRAGMRAARPVISNGLPFRYLPDSHPPPRGPPTIPPLPPGAPGRKGVGGLLANNPLEVPAPRRPWRGDNRRRGEGRGADPAHLALVHE